MADVTRIINEMNFLLTSQNVPVTKVQRINNDDLIWKVVFEGPEECAYEGGIFTVKFIFPKEYPVKGPEARFMTKMFHPNVDPSNDQHICINLLNQWDPNRTIEDVILGIFDLMLNPVTAGAYGNEATKLLRQDSDKYYDKVEEYTIQYAKKEC